MAGRVLVVDDDRSVAEELRVALAERGIDIITATGAADAATLLDEERFCGLVLDLVLDEGSGFDVLRHISKKRLDLPIVIISSQLPSYVREMLDSERVKLVLPKPVDSRLLSAIVLGLCGIAS